MSQIVDYLYEVGLTSLDEIRNYFLTNDIDTILSLQEHIGGLAFQDWCIAEYSPYSFAPSMDVSGFGGCSGNSCKIERANKFIKFSSLYSDNIYLIVNSITNPHIVQSDDDIYRLELINDYSLILLYSDLIRDGIAHIIPAHFSVCPDCFSKHVCNISDFSLIEPLVDEYADKAIMEATGYYKQDDMSLVTLRNLPELFPDHDGFFTLQGGKLSKLCRKVKQFPYSILQSFPGIQSYTRKRLCAERSNCL